MLKQSDSESYLWARKAANKGLAKAEYAVGCASRTPCLPSSLGVSDNLRSFLADYTEQGIGTNADLETAKKWYMRAAGESSRRERHEIAPTASLTHTSLSLFVTAQENKR